VASFGLDVRRRLQGLSKAEPLASRAALHALHLGRVGDAVEILEGGRTVFWTQYLSLRSLFRGLPFSLASELTAVSRFLEMSAIQSVSSDPVEDSDKSRLIAETDAARRRQEGERFQALLEKARAMPGFERLLLPETYTSLCAASSSGPIVLFLVDGADCRAILLRSPERLPEQIRLDKINPGELKLLSDMMRQSHNGARETAAGRAIHIAKTGPPAPGTACILKTLWIAIIKPVLDALGWQVSLPTIKGL
jgi:hypothetical protein